MSLPSGRRDNLSRQAENKFSIGAGVWLSAFAGWLVPGLGHVGQGRLLKGLVGGLAILALFAVGVALGGHVYSLRDTSEGLLSTLFGFCDLGSGLLYIASRATGFAVNEQPELATSEYGNVFMMVAGLLNFILALDAFDIGAGRKS
jgi:hypothetical protein